MGKDEERTEERRPVGGGWGCCHRLPGKVRSLALGLTEAVPATALRPSQMTDSLMHGLGEPAAGELGKGLWRQELKSCWRGHPGEPDKVKIGPSQIRPVRIKGKPRDSSEKVAVTHLWSTYGQEPRVLLNPS